MKTYNTEVHKMTELKRNKSKMSEMNLAQNLKDIISN